MKATQVTEEITEKELFLNRLEDVYNKATEKGDLELMFRVACKRYEVNGLSDGVKDVKALLEGLANV